MSATGGGGFRFITVTEDDDGQRLDRWLKKNAPDLPYILAQKFLRKGMIRIDGKRAKPERKLGAGEEVKIPPFETKGPKSEKHDKTRKISDEDAAFIQSLVIYDDGDVIALNKPAGIATQGGTKIKRHIDGLLPVLKDKQGVVPRLVHRLDKDTSGVMLLARSSKVAKALGDAFKGRNIKKIYWALLSPVPEVHSGKINAPLIKAGGVNREKMIIDEEEGKYAVTEFAVLERAGEAAAFVAFWPRTGRTHQIRIHAQTMGSSVIGDHKYKHIRDPESKKLEADFSDIDMEDRLHLHARRIILPHPTKVGKTLDITAPLSPELVKSWKAFGFNHKDKSDPFEGL
ncbi:MAG: RluA family pseudouridine synthase [Alphaproteobacteria bacterium]|nr:RluA family pseudouridine synthase [Alphaproteobacteria bacterium]